MGSTLLLPFEATVGSGRVGNFLYDVRAFGLITSVLDEKRWLGSGFAFLHPEWFVTAQHVVMRDGAPRLDLGVQVLGESRAVKSIFCHPTKDLALLVLSSAICSMPFMPAVDSLSRGRLLVSMGYSPRIPEGAMSLQDVRVPNPERKPEGPQFAFYAHIIENYKVEVRERRTDTERLMVFDAPLAMGGNSGGPVITETGGAVAVIIEQHQVDGSTIVKATSVIPILQLLRLPPAKDLKLI